MSITPALKTAARSAYRDVWRASSVTFRGDEVVLQAFRQKMRYDATNAAQQAKSIESYEESTKLFRDIAVVLRRNIVQASKVGESEGKDLYRVHIRNETELGDNDTVKNAPPASSNRSERKREKLDAALREESRSGSSTSELPVYYSALKRAHKAREVPELREEDLEESFIRGSGPGGQSINKTENNVQLHHKPTGLRVTCQDTRSLSQNRKIARKWLLQKLDKLINPGLSKEELKAAKQRERERRRRRKAKKRDQLKASEEGPMPRETDE